MSDFALNRLEHLWVDHFACGEFTGPSGDITNDNVAASAGIDASKLDHHYRAMFAQNHGTAAAAQRIAFHGSRGTGTIIGFKAGLVGACSGDSTISVDCYKNGSTILSAPISLDSGDAAFSETAGTLSVTTCADGDVFEVVVTTTPGTGTLGQGVFAYLDIDEPYPT